MGLAGHFMIAVIDYGLCNLSSIHRALEECGSRAFIANEPSQIAMADRCVLPGVGAFSQAMTNLRSSGLSEAILKFVEQAQRPFLGICLGMHLIGGYGEEGSGTNGIGLIPSKIVRLTTKNQKERIPHVGWNSVEPRKEGNRLFDDVSPGTDFYFLHSYHMVCDFPNDEIAVTPYCGQFVSAVRRDNILGVQFHPEKSQRAGLKLLKNFLAI